MSFKRTNISYGSKRRTQVPLNRGTHRVRQSDTYHRSNTNKKTRQSNNDSFFDSTLWKLIKLLFIVNAIGCVIRGLVFIIFNV